MKIGTTCFARFDGGNAHHRIAEPIARADKKAEGLQVMRRCAGRQVESAPRVAEDEWSGRFPAVVHPEPVFGRDGDFAFQRAVEFEREFLDRFALRFERRFDDAAPTRRADGVDGHGNKRRPGALRDDAGQRGGGGETIEKRRPQGAVTRVLVDENGENAAAFHQIDRIEVAFAAVEGFQAESAPVAVDETVEILVALGLEDGADRNVAHASDQLRVKFPVADVVDGHDHASLPVECGTQSGESFHLHAGLHRRLRHAGETRHAEQIGPEGVEMFADQPADFAVAHFSAVGDFHVAPRQPPVAGQNSPRNQTDASAETEDERQGESSENGQQGEHQQIDRVIHG